MQFTPSSLLGWATFLGAFGALLGLAATAVKMRLDFINVRKQLSIAQRQADDGHLTTLLGVIAEYRVEIETSKENRAAMHDEITSLKTELHERETAHLRGRQEFIAQITELRTQIAEQAKALLDLDTRHTKTITDQQTHYEKQLGEKELQLVGLRARVSELELKTKRAGKDLGGLEDNNA